MSKKTYVADFKVALYSTRSSVRWVFHVRRWFFPGFFAHRAARKYAKRRSWTLVRIHPL